MEVEHAPANTGKVGHKSEVRKCVAWRWGKEGSLFWGSRSSFFGGNILLK